MNQRSEVIEEGWIIVRSSEWVANHYAPIESDRSLYSIPSLARPAPTLRYRGLDRPALQLDLSTSAWVGVVPGVENEEAAVALLRELDSAGAVEDDFILDLSRAQQLFSMLNDRRSWELISAVRRMAEPPTTDAALHSLGYEPNYYRNDHFSPLCDALFFPRWHGTDREGTLFQEYHALLNENGLLNTRGDASKFLTLYLEQEWAETDGDYFLVELFEQAFD